VIQHVLAALLLAAAPVAGGPPLVLLGGTIVDVSGRSAHDVADSAVVIEGGEIVAVGPRRSIPIAAGARVVHVDGAYVLPGLSDVFAGMNSQAQADAYLYMGVTSIVGGDEPGGRRGALFTAARPSPRISRLGVLYGDRSKDDRAPLSPTESAAEADRLVRGEGARVLLAHYAVAPDALRAAVEKAHRLGVPVIGELGRTTYAQAMDTGVDAFVHTSRYCLDLASPELHAAVAEEPFGPPRTKFYEFLAGLNPDAPAVGAYARRLAASRVALIPTLSLFASDLPDHENPWKHPIAAILDPADIHLPLDRETGQRELAPGIPEGLAAGIFRLEKRFRRAGATYLAGSGTSAFGTLPGIALHGELKLLVGLGLSPRQALAAATSQVSRTLRWPKVGQIAKGAYADLVVLDADPTKDIRNLDRIRLVVLDGVILDRESFLRPPAPRE
jgi:hypothetical protein